MTLISKQCWRIDKASAVDEGVINKIITIKIELYSSWPLVRVRPTAASGNSTRESCREIFREDYHAKKMVGARGELTS